MSDNPSPNLQNFPHPSSTYRSPQLQDIWSTPWHPGASPTSLPAPDPRFTPSLPQFVILPDAFPAVAAIANHPARDVWLDLCTQSPSYGISTAAEMHRKSFILAADAYCVDDQRECKWRLREGLAALVHTIELALRARIDTNIRYLDFINWFNLLIPHGVPTGVR